MGEVTRQRLIGLDEYINTFSDNRQTSIPNGARVAASYFRVVEKEVRDEFASLEGITTAIDTALEWALVSYYSPAVVQIRPAEAKVILPTDNPKQSGLILGANLYKEIQVLRFLASTGSATNDTNAVGRYEGMLKFVCDKNGVTRAEIEKYYRDGIRGLVSDIADEEFNKISFRLYGYNAVLTRNPQNEQYTLRYTDARDNTKELPPASLEVLLVAIRDKKTDNKPDFVQSDIDTVRAQAALIPAVAYPRAEIQKAKDDLTNFYLNPTGETFIVLKTRHRTLLRSDSKKGPAAAGALYSAVYSLNPELADRVLAN